MSKGRLPLSSWFLLADLMFTVHTVAYDGLLFSSSCFSAVRLYKTLIGLKACRMHKQDQNDSIFLKIIHYLVFFLAVLSYGTVVNVNIGNY